MEAGKLFIEDALVAPWCTQKDIGQLDKSGTQIITLTRNSQVTLVVNKFSVTKITQHLFRFRRKLSYAKIQSNKTAKNECEKK